jgi:hypothetical protein
MQTAGDPVRSSARAVSSSASGAACWVPWRGGPWSQTELRWAGGAEDVRRGCAGQSRTVRRKSIRTPHCAPPVRPGGPSDAPRRLNGRLPNPSGRPSTSQAAPPTDAHAAAAGYPVLGHHAFGPLWAERTTLVPPLPLVPPWPATCPLSEGCVGLAIIVPAGPSSPARRCHHAFRRG